MREILGAWFLIQSPTKGCSHIKKSLDAHLATQRQKVAEMSDEDFKTHQESVYTTISEKDKSLREEYGRFWSELTLHRYQFERQE